MNVILLGAPGSGKGTQSFKLKEKYNLEHISTGDLFRNAIKNETELGLQVKEILKNGDLVTDELTLSIVEEAINKVDSKGFLLDGFPRTQVQAEMLDGLNIDIDAVLYFDVDTNVLIDRLTGRRVCKSCGASFHVLFNPSNVDGVCDDCGGELYQRDDDNEEGAKNRLEVFFESTFPLIDYYKNQGKLYSVDANQKIDKIEADINNIFEEIK